MIVIPAIDLKEGKAVRLSQGDFERETVYSENPTATARDFVTEGAKRIHVVDLDGAKLGAPSHATLIRELVEAVPVQFQVGGGIREPRTIEQYRRHGVWRVVLGTRACLDAGFLKESLSAFGDFVIVGIDAVKGRVATDGWSRVTDMTTDRMIDRVLEFGGKEIILTDIECDGMMAGPNFEAVRSVLDRFSIQVIASGGISSLQDVKTYAEMKSPRLTGVITGKALYEGKLSLKEAIALC